MKKNLEPLGPLEGDPVRRNEELGYLGEALRRYVDAQLENPPESLQELIKRSKAEEEGAMRAAGPWSWRYDVYLVLALLLLSFIAWRVSISPRTETAADGRTGQVQVSAQEAGSDGQHGNSNPGSGKNERFRARAVEAFGRYRADLYFVLGVGLLGAVLWRLHVLGVAVQQAQAVAGRTPVTEALLPVPEVQAGKTSIQPKWKRMWWPFGKRWHYERWTRFADAKRDKVADWLNRLALAKDLSQDQVASIGEEAVRWREELEHGRKLSDAETERCVRALFQYFYALYVRRSMENPRDKRSKKLDLPKVTGQRGEVPQEAVAGFAEYAILKARYGKRKADDPKLQVALVSEWIDKRVW